MKVQLTSWSKFSKQQLTFPHQVLLKIEARTSKVGGVLPTHCASVLKVMLVTLRTDTQYVA